MSLIVRQMPRVLMRTSSALLRPQFGYNALQKRTVAQVERINSTKIAQAIGPYSHAVKMMGTVYCSGQLPVNTEGKVVEGTIKERTAACLHNLNAVLVEAGSHINKTVKVTIFLTNMDDFKDMNEVYEEIIRHKPARSCVQVSALPKGVDIEIECIAAMENAKMKQLSEEAPGETP